MKTVVNFTRAWFGMLGVGQKQKSREKLNTFLGAFLAVLDCSAAGLIRTLIFYPDKKNLF